MPANLETSAVATGLEKSVIIPIPKKGNAKECSNYCTIPLISHARKLMLKILQARFQQYMSMNFQMCKLDLEKARNQRIKLQTSIRSLKKRVPEKHLLVLYCLYQSLWLCRSQQTVEILKEMRIPDQLICLLRNLCASQGATIITEHGTTDWF